MLVLACAPRVPVPPEGSQIGATPVAVPYPPPAARGEVLPPQPHEEAVWVDGHWSWEGDDYRWHAGRWMRLPQGMAYARAVTVRLRNGDLVYYEPRWIAAEQ